MAPKIEREQ